MLELEESEIQFESIAARFIREASEIVEKNRKLSPREFEENEELCLGCSQKPAQVRLTSCDCRGLFCRECMIRLIFYCQVAAFWISDQQLAPNMFLYMLTMDIFFIYEQFNK